MKLGLHVMQFPSGRFGYRGSIPTALGTAIPASTSAILGCRSFRAENGDLMEWKFPTFDTEQEAKDFAEKKGFPV